MSVLFKNRVDTLELLVNFISFHFMEIEAGTGS